VKHQRIPTLSKNAQRSEIIGNRNGSRAVSVLLREPETVVTLRYGFIGTGHLPFFRFYTVSQENDTGIAHHNFHADKPILIRPPDIVVGGPIFYQAFLLLLASFFRQLPAELAERHSTISGHMVGSKCNLRMHVRKLGYPLRLQIGDPKPRFSMISQPKGNFNGLYLWSETRYT